MSICDMDCFRCRFPDCINNGPATKQENRLSRMRCGKETPERSEKPKAKKTGGKPHAGRDREKRLAYQREYNRKNHERILAQQRAYNAAHRSEQAAYRVAHREEIIAKQRAYRAAHLEKCREYMRAWRRKRKEATGE